MSTQDNKALARGLVEEIINVGKLEAAAQYFILDYVDHAAPPGLPPGVEGFKAFFTALRVAFPDLHYHIEDVVAEGDLVVQRAKAHGTMKGDFMGMPATGKNAMWGEMHTVRVKDGKIVEHWANVDQLGMLQKLGLAPAPGGGA
jgi:predicted ester cyclase